MVWEVWVHAYTGLVLGLMLYCHPLEIFNDFCTRSPSKKVDGPE